MLFLFPSPVPAFRCALILIRSVGAEAMIAKDSNRGRPIPVSAFVVALYRCLCLCFHLFVAFVLGSVLDDVPISASPLLYLSLPISCLASCVSDCFRSTNGKETKTDTDPHLGQVKGPIETSTTLEDQLRQRMVKANTTVD